jgi:cell pole-organizing protein PopZ
MSGLRDLLKTGLSATPHEPAESNGPSVSDLADRIKALKAANTIEAAPQRIRQKQLTAEEPVTARIRRRSEGFPLASAEPPVEQHASAIQTEIPFQERILMERGQIIQSPERTV